ncbi:hypothetical protein FACS1894188_00310 [Clostridia bacterium]|nr:hypothetical protein FACS1894188_00310 [Clostridia bacterium]
MSENSPEVILKATELARSINGCDELRALKKLQEKINQDTALRNKLAEFKKRSIALEYKRAQDIPVEFEEEKTVGRLYAEIVWSEDGRRYLETENNLFNVLHEVYNIISETEFSLIQKAHQ